LLDVTELECLFTRRTTSCVYSLVLNDERQTILPSFVGMLVTLMWPEPSFKSK